jgi:hypothetical protein
MIAELVVQLLKQLALTFITEVLKVLQQKLAS